LPLPYVVMNKTFTTLITVTIMQFPYFDMGERVVVVVLIQ